MNALNQYLSTPTLDALNSFLQNHAEDADEDNKSDSSGQGVNNNESGIGKNAGDVDLKAHDARFHPDGFDPEHDNCSLRDKINGVGESAKKENKGENDKQNISKPQKVETGVSGVGTVTATSSAEASAAKKLAEMANSGDTKAWQALKEAKKKSEYAQEYGENNAEYEMSRQQQSSDKTNGEMAVQKEMSTYRLKPPLDKESMISKMSKMGQLKTPGAKTAAQNYIDSLNQEAEKKKKELEHIPTGEEAAWKSSFPKTNQNNSTPSVKSDDFMQQQNKRNQDFAAFQKKMHDDIVSGKVDFGSGKIVGTELNGETHKLSPYGTQTFDPTDTKRYDWAKELNSSGNNGDFGMLHESIPAGQDPSEWKWETTNAVLGGSSRGGYRRKTEEEMLKEWEDKPELTPAQKPQGYYPGKQIFYPKNFYDTSSQHDAVTQQFVNYCKQHKGVFSRMMARAKIARMPLRDYIRKQMKNKQMYYGRFATRDWDAVTAPKMWEGDKW